ncbi:hypothetical protein [Providencia burhodogranariea]|uniref:Thiamine biosynthesis protein ApbE n=1 Tax=Providencia burhodogranariea DSM 19968 TaxID=1141662 RepID=K8WPM3_9GAMM|nr:hypothetical protein [Providencia burhodogranariea]EKT62539.1 hypothetical protein OOA_07018 [Providencia burhodogranariea DSM 19968]
MNKKTQISLLLSMLILLVGCSTKIKHPTDASGCTIKIDTPEGSMPGKIEHAAGNSTECQAIEKAIDKAI